MKDCTPILKNLGELQMDSLKLEEENGTLPKGSFGESDRVSDLGERNLGLESRSSDVGSNSDPMSQYTLEPLENIDSFQKEKFEVANNLQAQMERGLKIAGDIEDSQNKLLSLETKNGVLKTEFQTSLQNKNGSKTTMNIINGSGAVGAQTPELNTVKSKSAEQQEMNPAALDMENKRIIRKEFPLECSNLQEESFVTRKESESIESESYNYLIEKDNERNQLAYKSDSMEEEMKVQEEVQARPELVQDLKKQIENLQRALQESQCKSTSLERKHERWVEAEVAHTKKENLKLKKQLSAKATELKNLQIMFSSLGKEKEVMTAELALKARILADMEEHLNDLKEQNKTLSNKLISFSREQKSKATQMQGTITLLQNRDKLLAEQLLKSSEACRALKRKLKELQEHNTILKKDTAKFNFAIQKQEKSTHILNSERKALRNELIWGKEQVNLLQEKFKSFKEKTESVTKEDTTKPNKQKSFIGEIASLEQMLIHFKEEITCLKGESGRRDKECQDLKEEVAKLQTELSYLDKESTLLKKGRTSKEIEKNLNGDNWQSTNELLKNKIPSVDKKIINMDTACIQVSNSMKEVTPQDKAKGNLFMNNSLQKLKQNNQYLGGQLVGVP